MRALALALALLLPSAPASADGAGGARTAPEPIFVDVTGGTGLALRLGSSPTFPVATRDGGVFAVGASVAPSRRLAIAIAYEHAGMGTEAGSGTYGTANVTRTLDELWLTLRLALYGDPRVSIGVFLGPGFVWQTAYLDGAVALTSGSAPLACTENAYGPDVGLRAGLGASFTLARRFVLGLDLTVDELKLSSDVLGSCIPGAGSTTLIGARASLSYRFDVSRALR